MNSDQPPKPSAQDREAALFEMALEKSGADREAFLQAVGEEESALQARLKVLLAAHEQEDGVLAAPPERVRSARKPQVADASPDEAVGHMVGRYKLLENLGEGGCGVVYVAEQTEPVRRRVALKVIKLGMETKAVVARFEAERQALAMMEHPNIAKVFDAGATDTGRPYFVMELVRGTKITEYCDQNKLPTKERLKLFIQVCHAIQHAHQKGIIHRDIKPSNILVTLQDGMAVPKVIDFGIAKATEGRLTDATVYTQLHQLIGTPAYMSPEQAEMTSVDVDTRSDIYSLGALLYELLTGRTPFDTQELMAAGIEAMRRTIRETEPARPSTRLAALKRDELTTTAKRRSAEAPRLISLLKGDLDWVVMKCLEKDRTQRYECANGLAADVQRHLNTEPVLARPPSRLYHLRKMLWRHKVTVASASAVGVVLLTGTGLSFWMFIREWRAPAVEGLQQRLQEMVGLLEAQEQESIRQTRKMLLAIADSRAAAGLGAQDCKRLVDGLFADYPGYANLGVVDPNTTPVASAVPFAFETHQKFFRRVLETRAFTIDDFDTEPTNGKPTVLFGCPILDRTGQIQGLAFAALDWRFSVAYLSGLSSKLPKEATLTEIDDGGKVLLRLPTGDARLGQPLPKSSIVRSVLNKREGVVEDLDPAGGPAVYAFVSRRSQLYSKNVVAILSIPKQVLLARAQLAGVHHLAWLSIASGASIALGVALGWLSSRPLARPR